MEPTKEQQRVIEMREGTGLVSACPGSGKTATLVKRVKAMPAWDEVQVCAFNKRAAEEFNQRAGREVAKTFHAMDLRRIMREPQAYGFSRKPEVKTSGIFWMICEANGKEKAYEGWDDSPWDAELVAALERGCYTADLAELEAGDPEFGETYAAVRKLREWQLRKNIITFDAMNRLVAERVKGGWKIPPECDHFMVDEYQDVDRFQFDVTAAIGEQTMSLCVVGDPNQRIYEWRGALEGAFDEMGRCFPEAKRLPLTCNFRSMDGILRLAEESCPVGMHGVRGDDPQCVVWEDPQNQVTDLKILAKDENVPLKERAILARYNKTCAMWQLGLAKAGVPVMLVGKSDFWRLKHVQMATEARERGETANMLFQRADWARFARMKRFRDEPKQLEEVMGDVSWLLSLTDADFKLLRDMIQNEEGVRVSTIHKAKGAEWKWVMLSGADEKLRRETYVWYVAVTRAKDKLVLA